MASGLDAALTPYRVLRNLVDYPLRRWLRIRRPVRGVPAAGLDRALGFLEPRDQREARRLIRDYELISIAARGTRRDVLENLFYLEMLLTALDGAGVRLPAERVEAIDVGVGHWFYLHALAGALRHWRARRPRELQLLGFEADPYRLYGDGHTRADWAAWHLRGIADALFVPEDVRRWRATADAAFMLFPFVFATDADKWGLPRTMFRPLELLTHVWRGVRPSGALVVANQGRREADEQRRLFDRAEIEPTWSARFASPFFRYREPRYVCVAVKPAGARSST
ncbi:MAG TPA: hypothetical protein VG370_17260 [Chloroflexota bacterium]|jgi:hypothetical protein|nr:hypothetical protein [Chloroflexota bacterium]